MCYTFTIPQQNHLVSLKETLAGQCSLRASKDRILVESYERWSPLASRNADCHLCQQMFH